MTDLIYFLVAGSESLFPVDLSDIQEAFVKKLQSYFPDNLVEWVGLNEVRSGLGHKIKEARDQFPEAEVVTLSALYYPFTAHEISANRLVDEQGNDLGLGPRPKADPLEVQVSRVMEAVDGKSVIVVDDTLFLGETLNHLVGLGLNIVAAVEYFTKAATLEDYHKRNLPIFAVHAKEDYLDVLPLHDFLPPLPLCGKVVGDSHSLLPRLNEEGMSACLPYLLPWITREQLASWASVPVEHAPDFSVFALERSIEVVGRIGHFGFTTMGESARFFPPRTSVPYLNGDAPYHNASVVEYLRGCLHQVRDQYTN